MSDGEKQPRQTEDDGGNRSNDLDQSMEVQNEASDSNVDEAIPSTSGAAQVSGPNCSPIEVSPDEVLVIRQVADDGCDQYFDEELQTAAYCEFAEVQSDCCPQASSDQMDVEEEQSKPLTQASLDNTDDDEEILKIEEFNRFPTNIDASAILAAKGYDPNWRLPHLEPAELADTEDNVKNSKTGDDSPPDSRNEQNPRTQKTSPEIMSAEREAERDYVYKNFKKEFIKIKLRGIEKTLPKRRCADEAWGLPSDAEVEGEKVDDATDQNDAHETGEGINGVNEKTAGEDADDLPSRIDGVNEGTTIENLDDLPPDTNNEVNPPDLPEPGCDDAVNKGDTDWVSSGITDYLSTPEEDYYVSYYRRKKNQKTPKKNPESSGSKKNLGSSGSKKNLGSSGSKNNPEPSDSKKNPEPSDSKKNPEPSDSKKNPKPSDSKKNPEPSDSKNNPEPSDSKNNPESPDPKKTSESPDPQKNSQSPDPKNSSESSDRKTDSKSVRNSSAPDSEKSGVCKVEAEEMDVDKEEPEPKADNEGSKVGPQPGPSNSSSLKMKSKVVKKGNRCCKCNSRLNLYDFVCKCKLAFCITHRHPEAHGCTFDYRAAGAEEIRKKNPQIVAEKVPKI